MKRYAVYVALMMLPGVVFAESGFKDGPHFAYPHGGDVERERAGFGWQVAYEWNAFLSAEFSASRHTDRQTDLLPFTTPLGSDVHLEVVPLVLTARAGYSMGPVHLYGGVGGGWYYMRGKASRVNQSLRENPNLLPDGLTGLQVSVDVKNTFAYHLALGAEWMLTHKWEVFAEYRWVRLDTTVTIDRIETRPARSGTLGPGKTQTSERSGFDYNHGLFRLGVNYRF